jgi:ribose transport system substrate-binding protein
MNATCQDVHAIRKRSAWCLLILLCVCVMAVPSSIGGAPAETSSAKVTVPSLSIAEMRAKVTAASEPAAPWNGPRSGPAGQARKTVAIISEDLRNGGILGVAQGIHEAATAMKWTVKVFDAGGTPSGRDKAASDALASQPDGVILIGADAKEMHSRLSPFSERAVPIVGWHVGPKAGPMANAPVAVNVSTDPMEVARITALAAVTASEGHAGVVLFTDSNFEIAQAKAKVMADVIRGCKDCTLLEVRDIAISKSAERMPAATRELLARYGKRWTHALAINDIYFDYAIPELTKAGQPANSMSLLSAGDGSAAAFMRIQAGIFQTGTVAEPLNLHGWQLVDELNRLLAHWPVSGYVAPAHLVTGENVAFDGGPRLQYDPENGYRGIYRHIWKR